MRWRLSWRADPQGRALADRHYSRQKVGAVQFVRTGACVVLKTVCGRGLWVSSWQRHVRHEWPGAWECALFRNEGAGLSSELIREAVAATRAIWAIPPERGIITMVNPDKVRRKRDPGRCFRKAGFRLAGTTKGGLLVWQLLPADMPDAEQPIGSTASMLEPVAA